MYARGVRFLPPTGKICLVHKVLESSLEGSGTRSFKLTVFVMLVNVQVCTNRVESSPVLWPDLTIQDGIQDLATVSLGMDLTPLCQHMQS